MLDRAGIHEVRPGLQIVAAPWRSKAPTTDLVAEVLEGLSRGPVTRILVAHGGVDVLDPDHDKPSLIRLAELDDALARGAVHYVALGDKHSRTQVGSTGRGLVFRLAGGHQLRRRRIRPWSCPGRRRSTRTTRGAPSPWTARHVGRWRFVTLHRQVDNSRDIADLDLNLDLMPDKDRTVVRLA